MSRAGTELADRMDHLRAYGIQRRDLATGIGAHLAVTRLGPGTQFAHVAEHQDGASGKAGQYINRRPD
ncbi:hypothetical protein D3C81_1868200 [compost metagenome]